MSGNSEIVVFCGYHDRAFWAEMLQRCFGFRDAREGKRRAFVSGKPVEGGQFAFLSPADCLLRIRPCSGRSEVFESLGDRLARRGNLPVQRLVVSVDSDAMAVTQVAASVSATLDAVAERARRADAAFKRLPAGDLALDGRDACVRGRVVERG